MNETVSNSPQALMPTGYTLGQRLGFVAGLAALAVGAGEALIPDVTSLLTGYAGSPATLSLGLKTALLGAALVLASPLARPRLGAGVALLTALFAGLDLVVAFAGDASPTAYVAHGTIAVLATASTIFGILLPATAAIDRRQNGNG